MTAIGSVAISVSDPAPEELARRGLTRRHVQHAFIEIARQVLAAGGDLAYGGDLRKGGYTQILIALLHTYPRQDRPAAERIRQYLASYLFEEQERAETEELARVAALVVVEGPGEEEDAGSAISLLRMRKAMAAQTDCRVLLGGRLQGQSGRWPGLVEEAYWTVAEGRPLFVLGGAGGAAARLAAAMRGEWPRELTTEFQLEHTPAHEQAAALGVGPDEEELRGSLQGLRPENGLSAEENEQLQETSDLDLMVAMTMKGLRGIAGAPARPEHG